MKKTQNEVLETAYNFCGTFDWLLKRQYKRSKISAKGVTFPQFCIVMYNECMNDAKSLSLITPKKRTIKKGVKI